MTYIRNRRNRSGSAGLARLGATLAALLCACGQASALDTVQLSTGEKLKVEILEITSQSVRFRHPVLGELTVPAENVRIAPADATAFAAKTESHKEPPPPDVPREKLDPPKPGEAPRPSVPEPSELDEQRDRWRGGVEGGVSGTEGNSQSSSLRFGLSAKRQSEILETAISSSVVYATDRGEKTASRGELSAQNDWLLRNSPWGFFVRGRAEYDEFQDWDWRLSAYAGPSYAFIRNSRTTLRARVGAGAAYEFGGESEAVKPEGLAGLDLAHRLTERQDLYMIADYLPSLSNFPQYRLDLRAGWRVLIDPETRMNLHIGAADRYDSSPGPDKDRSDIEYFMTIGWQF